MSVSVQNIDNSFVTFFKISNQLGIDKWVTDSDCAIKQDFCIPVFDREDLAFQNNFISTQDLRSDGAVQVFTTDGVSSVQVFGYLLQVEQIGTFGGSTPIYNVWIDFVGSDLSSSYTDGECFTIVLSLGGTSPELFQSNQCFKKIADKCLSVRLVYTSTDNCFGFYYDTTPTRRNRVRLPIYLKDPLIDGEKTIYQRQDGTTKLVSARLRKRFKCIVDSVPESIHQRLNVALNHDNVRIVTDNEFPNLNGFQAVFEGEYNNIFPSIMQQVNAWPAEFMVYQTPYNQVNSNCS
jgi:hypothetical protein